MNFAAAMALLTTQQPIRRGLRTVRHVEGPQGPINVTEAGHLFIPSETDKIAQDWELVGAVPAADLADPGSPAADADAQPEDTSNPPAAPLSDESPPQDGVSLPASGAPAADEPAAAKETSKK